MKKLLPLVLILLVFLSCDNTETYSPALQGVIDNQLYRSIDARATENEDGSFLIQGVTENETLTMKVADLQAGTYDFGGNSSNYGAFEDFDGNTYFTNPDGDGQIVISNYNPEAKIVSGAFEFTAIRTGVDTLRVGDGVFFEIPVAQYVEPAFNPSTNAGTFVSFIDGNPFNPFNISAVENTNSVVISGSSTSITILLSVPKTIEPGNFELPAMGFIANYIENGDTQEAISGNLSIISHNQVNNVIKGTFSFLTPTKSIAFGQFNVVYE
mgnify:CR=1 FL=1